MATDTLQPPQNPVELATMRAQHNTPASDNFDLTPEEERALAELDYAASELGFIGQNYFFTAVRGLIIPKEFDATEEVTYESINDVMAEGPFATFSKVKIGRIIGSGTVRALCLAFDDAIVLPYLARLEENEMLFVPVLSIESILPTN